VGGQHTIAYRHFRELCVLLALRDGLRSGDVWVPGSRRYADPTTILMPAGEWEQVRAEYCALVGVPATAEQALAQAEEVLRAALLGLEPLLERGDGPVRVTDQGELLISKLTAEEVPDEVETVRMGLVGLLPRFTDHRAAHRGRPVDRLLRQAHPRRARRRAEYARPGELMFVDTLSQSVGQRLRFTPLGSLAVASTLEREAGLLLGSDVQLRWRVGPSARPFHDHRS
jgi:hypothetical protein